MIQFDPTDPGFIDDPYPTYARLRDEAPVLEFAPGVVVVSRYADVVHVLKSPGSFSSEAMGGGQNAELSPTSGSLIAQDPPVHTRQRGIVNRGFTPRRISAYEPRVRELCDELFAKFEHRGEVELTAELASPLPIIMIAELLGLDPERRDDFKRWSNSIILVSTAPGQGPDAAEHARNLADFRAYIRAVVEQRRAEPRRDLISLLVHAEEEDGVLDADQVCAFASLLLIAGAETTTNLIGNAVLALLSHPDSLARVVRDPGLIPRLTEETLRWDSPVQLILRLATQESELGGTPISKGSRVVVLLGSANRDPRQFTDPERFDLDRNAQGHLGFGLGNHFCLGSSLARLEARVALEAILGRLPRLRAGAEPFERHGSFLVRGARKLPLSFSTD